MVDATRTRSTALRGAAADLAVAAGAVGLAWAVLALFAFPYDDAFIHLRIARNLAEHGRPYFNPGEAVLGSSSPLWTLVLGAGFAWLGTASYAFVGPVEAAVVAVTALCAHRLLAGPRPGGAATALAALLAAATLVPSAGGAMETPLAMLLLTAAVLAMARGRWRWAGALLALAAACRLELAVAAAAALAVAPRGRRRAMAAPFAAVAAAIALWLVAAYGTVLPNTLAAKATVYRLTWAEFLSELLPHVMPLLPVRPRVGALALSSLALAAAAAAVAPIVWPRLRAAVPEHRALSVLGALAAALAAGYAALRAMVFPWYAPLVVFPAALGLALVTLRWPRVTAAIASAARRRLAWAGLALLAAGPAAAVGLGVVATARDVAAVEAGRLGRSRALIANARARTYLEIGADLERRCPGRTVLAAEIGALGWTYRGRIIDGVGLVSPEVLPYHPLRVPDERISGLVGAYPARAVVDLRPDLIVTMEIFNSDFAGKAPDDPLLRRYAVVDARPVFSPTLPPGPERLWESSRVLVMGDPAGCAGAASGPPR